MLLIALILTLTSSLACAENNRTFPDGFLFGVATGSYQVEGAWDEDGKGESIWDHFVHTNSNVIQNNDTGDIACDSYHKYKEDVALAADLGVKLYRFSISWPRILPTGIDNEINLKGISYYQSLVDEIINHNMTPVATLYHYDLPQVLQDLGGWPNTEMVDYFVNYARVAIKYLDKVKYWLTFNEPRAICRFGYGAGTEAPGIKLDGVGEYLCAYTLVKAHAAAYKMLKEEFPKLTAKMSMAINLDWAEPASNSTEDQDAAERRNSFEFGLYAHPIYKGNWPQVVIDRVKARSEHENYINSRLPEFTAEEVAYINGTFDYMGLNTYYTNLVADIEEAEYGDSGYMKDMKIMESIDPSWNVTFNGNAITPWGTRKVLKYLKDNYNNPEILITENGIPDDGSTLTDNSRISFFAEYLSAILDAMYEDKVNVIGYIAWSLLDNFEWLEGYRQHFGLYKVDFTSLNRTRTPKKSVDFFHKIVTTLKIPADDGSTSTTSSSTVSTTVGSSSVTTTVSSSAVTTSVQTTTPSAASRIPTGVSLLLISCIAFCFFPSEDYYI